MKLRALVFVSALLPLLGCKNEAAPVAAPTDAAVPAASASAHVEAACSGPDVDFRGNTEMETEIRAELHAPTGPIAKTDVAKIGNVNLIQMKTDELDPCIFPLMTGAGNLFLGPGDVHDLTPLSELTKINALQVAFNKVSDISPLAKMTAMDRLDLERTQVEDIGPLASMKALTQLQLDGTPVKDLTPLAGAKSLEKLSIRNTQVADLSPLKGLTSLKFLYVEGTPIKDTSPLSALQSKGLKIVKKGRM